MWADMKARFTIDGGRLRMERIEIDTDGATTVARRATSTCRAGPTCATTSSRACDFPRMREIFFRNEPWPLAGDGRLHGHVPPVQGRARSGRLVLERRRRGLRLSVPGASRLAALDAQALRGHRRRVRPVTAATASFDFSIAPLGSPERPTARFDAGYADVDLAQVSDFYELPGPAVRRARRRGAHCSSGRSAGSASSAATGGSSVAMPPGAEPMDASLAAARAADRGPLAARMGSVRAGAAAGPSARSPATATYRFDAIACEVDAGRFATETHARGVRGRDRVGRELRVPLPRDEPRLAGERSGAGRHPDRLRRADRRRGVRRTRRVRRRDDRARSGGPASRASSAARTCGPGTRSGATATRRIVVENSYVTVDRRRSSGRTARRFAPTASSRSAIPRRDGGEEIDARFRVAGATSTACGTRSASTTTRCRAG